MFGVGTSELIVIILIALLILGPAEIPKVARTFGRAMREVKRVKDELSQNIEFENNDPGVEAKAKEIKKNDTAD